MTPGQLAYEAYSAAVGGKSVAGKALPAWAEVKPEIAAAWETAAEAVRVEYATQSVAAGVAHDEEAARTVDSPLGAGERIILPPTTPPPY